MAIVRHGNWVTIRREEWSFCAPVSTPGWDSWMHVSLTRYKTVVPQLCNRGRNFIGRGRPLLTRAAARDWQHSLSLSGARTKSSRPKAHVRPIHLSPGGKKGGQGKSPLLLDVRSPPPTVTYCTAYKAFPSGERNSRLFFSSSLFFTIDAIIPRLSLYKLESRWVYKTLSVLVFFSFLFFETMENGEDSKDLETKDSKIPALPFLRIIPVDAE